MPVSATLAINETVSRRRDLGLPVLALGFGEVGLPVHPDLRAAFVDAAGRNAYGPVTGSLALREAAAGYWARRGLPTDPDLVVAGPGSKPLLYALLQAIGGGVALPRPSWVSYAAQATLLHQRAWLLATPPGEGGVPDPSALERAAKRARASGDPLRSLVLTVPDNPTGTVASDATIRGVCEVARRHDLLIIADEIYRDLLHTEDRELLSPAELAPERTIITSGPSKMLALGGWRIGVTRLPDTARGRQLHETLAAIASEIWSSPPMPAQHAAALGFEEPPALRERVAASRVLHARVARAVADRFVDAGVALPPPAAAFYLYPSFTPHTQLLRERYQIRSDVALARFLLERHGIATLPGSAFGDRPGHLRLRVATSLLYGQTDEQRLSALEAREPEQLPWIAASLDTLGAALQTAVERPHARRPA